jgi:outer membrane protein assembly factor BamB
MEKNIKKTKLIPTILMIVILTISILTIILPVSIAQEYRTKQTYAYIGAIPNPVGVNQQVLLHIGITDYLVVVSHGWEDLTVSVTKPDGTTETLGPFRTDSTGGTGAIYTPTMIGTYTFVTNFPEQMYSWTNPPAFSTNIYGDILYLASTSEPLELEVQQEPIEHYPWSQLPTEYWTRPIDGQLREWSTISANWLTTPYNHIAPFNEDAPETAHILWAKPIAMGGLAGGVTGNHAFECGDAYEGFFSGTVIIGGILYYNEFNSRGGTNVDQVVVAVDLHTGEEVWRKNWDNRRLSFGQTFYWDSYNYHGVFDYLWVTIGSTWKAYDAFSGRWEYTMEGVPSGSNIYGPKGEIYRYTVNRNAGWMTLWNSSRVVSNAGSWRPHGNTYDATNGIEWNVTIPLGLPGGTMATWFQERMIGCDAAGYVSMGDLPIHTWALDLRPGHEGELLFNSTWNPPPGDLSITWGTRYNGAPSLEEKVYTLYARETRQHYGFSLDTGQQIWGPTPSQDYMDFIGVSNIIAEGKLFSTRMAGHLVCYDVTDGTVLWTYEATDPYSEMNWANNWPIRPLIVTDGKIYYVMLFTLQLILNLEEHHTYALILKLEKKCGEQMVYSE